MSPFTDMAREGATDGAREVVRLLGKRWLRGVPGALLSSAASCCCSRPVASITTSTATLTLSGAPQMLQRKKAGTRK